VRAKKLEIDPTSVVDSCASERANKQMIIEQQLVGHLTNSIKYDHRYADSFVLSISMQHTSFELCTINEKVD